MLLSAALSRFFPYPVRQRGEQLQSFNAVRIISGGPFDVEAEVQGSRRYEVHLERDGNDLLVSCECPYFDSDGACKHIWGVLLEAGNRGYLLGNRGTAPSRLIEDWIDGEPLGRPPSSRALADRPRAAPWQGLLQEIQFHESRKAPADAWRADREIYYVIDVAQSIATSSLYLEATHRDLKKDGEWGRLKTANFSRLVVPQLPDGRDREILTVLGGVHDPYTYSFPRDTIPFVFRMSGPLIELVMPKVCATGRCRLRLNSTDALEQQTPLSWDEGPPWQFRLAVERGSKGWLVRGIFARAGETMDLRLPTLLIPEGFLFVNGRMARFEDAAAFGWIRLLRRESKIDVPFEHAGEFLGQLLEQPAVPPADWPEELRYKEVAVKPRPHLKIEKSDPARLWGKPALFGRLSFDYAGAVIEADSAVRGVYDAQQRQLMARDLEAERGAHELLLRLGLKAGAPYELSPARLPAVVRELSAAGWGVEADGKTFRTASGIRAEVTSGIDWFELQATVDYGASELKLPDLLKAIRRGESMVTLDDGSLGLIPEDLLDRYGMLIAMGRAQGDHVRFSRAQTGVLDALLAAREEIRFDAGFERARAELRRFDRIEAAHQPSGFVGELRVYQREGLGWMQFLQCIGFGGCLADDMGVGKTPQVLALLETRRELRDGGQPIGPALVVVPRSLIFNWMQESARFTPGIRVLDHSGSARSKNIQELTAYDLILTTYGTLRRDAVEFQNLNFDYVILDEAQAIKNANSESAKAARLLRADHRLAMSGTPIENHLGELWSLFEFLNPGMLGSIPGTSAAGKAMRNPDEATRELLAKAVRPFILRRTKDQVAKELPPKLEQTIYCELQGTQRKQYNELRDHYRRAVLGRIDSQGMAKSKMHILEALLRLRQAACHPGLLDDSRRGESSAKFEVLLPQLAEVIEEGHKALVFSQFTSLLSIVRDELDSSNTAYEYLDGRTRDRQARVERFQSDPDCKLFLISLKAGGVGLNLTAAEYVFLLDPWWNPAVEAQAIDRTHRIGQRNRVFAYRLIARDTVEEKVLELQGHKRNLADAIIRADTNLVRDLKREDLEFLLS